MTRSSFWKAAICCLVVFGASLQAQEQERIAIYVGPQARDGFVDMDAGIRDSIPDIQQECQASGFSIVPDLEKAKLVVIVVGRPVKGDFGFGSAVGGIASAFCDSKHSADHHD